MRVQAVEQETGLDRATIRFYEREGFVSPKRSENGYRDYTESDVELLLKIKLLRQLGFSLERVMELHQGDADFDRALSDQIRILANMVQTGKTSMIVCQTMRRDAAVYESLDSKRYLILHRELSKEGGRVSNPNFQESIPEEIHPWLRFFARVLDLALLDACIMFLLVVVFRVRPIPDGLVRVLIEIAVGIMMIPLEALLLSKFGTTPGKYALGIHMDEYRGRYLPFKSALWRAGNVFIKGIGLRIPIISEIAMLHNFCQLIGRSMRRFARYDEVQKPTPMSWDEETEITYKGWTGKGICALILSVILVVGISTITALDGIKPRYRGDSLTMAQFVENYNTYLTQTNQSQAARLLNDGKKESNDYVAVLEINGDVSNQNYAFSYEINNDIVEAVIYENSWSDVWLLYPLNSDAYTAAATLVLSQKGCGLKELEEFSRIWDSHLNNKDVSFRYKNITVEWSIEMEKGNFLQNTISYSNEEDAIENRVTLFYRVSVHPAE